MGSRRVSPLIVITGPTASGKTSLAVDLAEKHNGEIICADSRTVYKGMDIGTAKASQDERSRVQHWGLDLVEPSQRFTAADFKNYANEKIIDIRSRGKLPFLVGGTGLYIDSVVFDYQFGRELDSVNRYYLESLSTEDLIAYCQDNSIDLPIDKFNRRRLIRAIERGGDAEGRRDTPLEQTIVVGISTNKEILKQRIASRSEQLLSQAVVNETINLAKKYPWELEAMTGNIYPLVRLHLEGGVTLAEIKKQFMAQDWSLARRQLTWFRRNPYIVWLLKDQIPNYLEEVLVVS